MTTAFIEAKNALLRASIEKRMNDYEKLIEDLQSQKAQLERERGKQYSEKDLREFIAELLKGNPDDKDYQKKLIDNVVTKVFVGDGFTIVHMNIANASDVEEIRLAEIKKAFEHLFNVQTLSPLARQKGRKLNNRLTSLINGRAILFNRYFISRARSSVLVWRLTVNGIICGVVLRFGERHLIFCNAFFR